MTCDCPIDRNGTVVLISTYFKNNFGCRDNVLGTGLSLESNCIFYGIQPAQPAQLPKQKHNILLLKLNAFLSDERGLWESEVTVIG